MGGREKYFAAWRNLTVQKVWITTGENPTAYGSKCVEIQTLLRDLAWASNQITRQLYTLTGFGVTAYMAKRDSQHRTETKFFLAGADRDRVEGGSGNCRQRRHLGEWHRSDQHADERLQEGLNPFRVLCCKYWAKPSSPLRRRCWRHS